MCNNSSLPEYDNISNLIQRRNQLDDRDNVLELQEIRLRQSAGIIDGAEADLLTQQVFARTADSFVARRSFRERFCSLYSSYISVADNIEQIADLAERVCTVISELYPQLLVDLSVATLSAIVILKRGVDFYCSVSSPLPMADLAS
jgi:hypothetical protein